MRAKSTAQQRGKKEIGPPPALRRHGAALAKPRVLIVDDDLSMREIAEFYLQDHGYVCTAVETAAEAMRSLEDGLFDLLITDLHMPGMDGMALLAWVKQYAPGTKVMMITGDIDSRAEQLAYQGGVAKYLVKPFPLHELLREVRESLLPLAPASVPSAVCAHL